MKLFHLADLHLGKRVNGISMLADQDYILKQVLMMVDLKKPDAVLLCGDIYDKPIPPEEAVHLFDHFLRDLSRRGVDTFVIAGNHDSAERLAFGSSLMRDSHVYMADVFQGSPQPIRVPDTFGYVNLYLLPFLKPAMVRAVYPDAEVTTYEDALRYVVEKMNPDPAERNILLSHQFVTGAKTSESEDVTVGGLDQVPAGVFEPFDYTALGHLHRPQSIGSDRVRYSGTPLKYSLSEAADQKGITVVELQKKGRPVRIQQIPLIPMRDMREIRGTYAEITARPNYIDTNTEDYVHVVLTDEHDIPDVMNKLRTIYPNIMSLEYDNVRTRERRTVNESAREDEKTPAELFQEFYEIQNNTAMSPVQKAFTEALMKNLWEEAT